MKLRRLIAAALLTISLATTGICFAFDQSDMNIGGIYLGQPMADVIAMYGQPIAKEPLPPKGINFVFVKNGGKFRVGDVDTVNRVTVRADSAAAGLATKAGIKLGSTVDDIFNAYGTPSEDFTFPKPNAFTGSRVISYSKLIVADTQYNLKDELSLSFNLDSNNKVIIMSYSKMRYN